MAGLQGEATSDIETGDGPDESDLPALDDISIDERRTLALRYTGVATWAWDVGTDVVHADAAFRELFGIGASEPLTAARITDQILPEDRLQVGEALERTVATGEPYEERFRVVIGDEVRWLRGIGEVHEFGPDGKAAIVIGLNMDISSEMETEERLVAIVGEMRHRIKNSLAMVNSLAAATARESSVFDDFIDKFRGRIDAMAAAQRAIGATGETHLVDLRTAIEGAMEPFLATVDWRRRIEIALDEAEVVPSLGQALALTVYELATNAIKYGALRYDGGTIEMRCSVSPEDQILIVDWREKHDGQPTRLAADSTGFGTKLIDRLIRAENGTIERDMSEGGYRVRLSFPLTTV